jgi:hypothetical protein
MSLSRREVLSGLTILAAAPLGGCAAIIDHDDIQDGTMTGHVVVKWVEEDKFVYLRQDDEPLVFVPSFWKDTGKKIDPQNMFTTGGSVPRVFWSIPGLSPWALGPAYIIHDWIFEVHRCHRSDPDVASLTFEDSAVILAEVGKWLITHKLIKHDLLDQIVWAVRTKYARGLWNAPGTPEECASPTAAIARNRSRLRSPESTVLDWRLPK